MRIFKLAFILIVMILGASFAVLNADPVLFNYYLGSRDLPLSLILIAALGAGVLIGVVATIGMVLEVKRENLSLKRRSRLINEEVQNLRSIPLKDR